MKAAMETKEAMSRTMEVMVLSPCFVSVFFMFVFCSLFKGKESYRHERGILG